MEVVAGLALVVAGIAGGLVYGQRIALAQARDTIDHLRGQIQHLSGAPARQLAAVSGSR